ncbi:MAG: hypothetical protein CMJ58_20815 [Planctomycetaceae bacterium]|nr:hypothetical protein [Planctomycetaceae bacterium]
MFQRLIRAVVAFVVTAAMYQGYVLAVAPIVDPPPAVRPDNSHADADVLTGGQDMAAKYQQQLAGYFPAGHWSSQAAPWVLENGQTMIVLSDFKRQDAQIIARRCAMLLFPSGRNPGGQPARDVIIMEPSGGAVLEGQNAGDGPAVGFGKLERAWLNGTVTIRSDMREAGPADDLLLTTREIYINRDLIRTDERVEMRLGPHFGAGRGLEIRLLEQKGGNPADNDSLVGRFESLEITDQVSLEIVPGALSMPGDESSSKPRQPEPPLRVTSRGPFRIDFGNYVASFIDDVQAWQIHPGGVQDKLQAERVNLYFARAKKKKSTAARASSSPLGAGYELAIIEAQAGETKDGRPRPVKLEAPFRQARAECKRLRIELRSRHISVEGEDGEDVWLAYRGAEIHAPQVLYFHPAADAGHVLGELQANGSGWLQAVVDKKRPHEPLEVRWTESLRIDRVQNRPVLSIRGRPRLKLGSTGSMWADKLELLLVERPVNPIEAATSPLPWAVAPERLTAIGNVAIDSPELLARVEQLRLDVKYPPAKPGTLALNPADGAGAPADPLARLGRAAKRTYRVSGKRLEMTAVVRDGKPDLSDLELADRVIFEEVPTAAAKDAPLRIDANRVTVANADTASAKIDIIGTPPAPQQPGQLAQITARGATLRAPQISVIRGRSQVQIESPGEVELLLDRDLSGQPLPRPEPLKISWQKWMRLDRDRLVFRGRVLCENTSGWLSTQQLGVLLSEEVSFDGSRGGARPEVIQLDASEGVVAEFDQRDATGITSHQHVEVVSILANQKTGEIRGQGPGWLESVHLATGKNPLAAIAPPGSAPPPASDDEPGQKLRHLRVDFVRGIGGNVHQRRVNLLGDVRAVYGPVDSWEQRLPVGVGVEPGPNIVHLDCDELQVGESPLARVNRPPGATGLAELELSAIGNVKIEGQAPKRGLFAASAARATFDEYKGMFVLEGDAARPAMIAHQEYVGAPRSENVARKLTYFQRTGEVKEEGVHKIEWNQFDIGRPPSDTQQR